MKLVLNLSDYRYQMVWQETLNTFRDMVTAEMWEGKKTIDVPVTQHLTFKVQIYLSDEVLSLNNLIVRTIDHWEMWFRVCIQLEFTPKIGRWQYFHPGSTPRCGRHPHDCSLCPQMGPKAAVQNVFKIFCL